jgi:hypothetical protein
LESLWSFKFSKKNFKGQISLNQIIFIPLEISSNVDLKMGSHDPFEYLKHKLWPKERPGVKVPI